MKKETIMKKKVTNTGFNGVTKRVRTGRKTKFEARLNFNSTTNYIGSYNTLNEAVQERVKFITNLI